MIRHLKIARDTGVKSRSQAMVTLKTLILRPDERFAAGAVSVIFSANIELFDGGNTNEKTLYVGLDVHKDTIAVAVAEDGRGGENWFYGTIVNSADAVLRLTKTLTKNGQIPSFCYDAGPCGYG